MSVMQRAEKQKKRCGASKVMRRENPEGDSEGLETQNREARIEQKNQNVLAV